MGMVRYCLAGALLLLVAGSSHDAILSEQNSKASASDDFVFEVQPREIAPGESAELHWSIKDASQITIEEASESAARRGELRELGTFQGGTGTLKITPTENTTYIISCVGNTKYSCASLSVRVRVKRP